MNKLFGGLLTIIVSVAFASNANAGLVFGDGSAQIGYGQQYVNSLGAVLGDDSSNVNFFRQSTVFFDPHWAIATGHGLREIDSDPGSLYSNLSVTLGQNFFTNPGETRSVTEAFIHPLYDGTDNGYDLALLYFENPFATVNPVSFYTGDIQVGMESDIAGYGRLQFEDSFSQTLTGDLRAGNNVISDVPYNYFGTPNYVATRLEPSSFPNYRPLGMGGTNGDSGGGLFINGQLAGVTAFQVGNPFFGAHTAYNVFNPEVATWVSNTRGSTAVPEPSSVILFGIGGAIAAFKRRRKINSI